MDRILDVIQSPADLKLLTDEELSIVANEIRAQIIQTTSKTGGHVASSLGAVEIILAVHSLIDAPTDKFIFDVGHQAYAHKLVTGRRQRFDTLRQYGGISGFPRPDESVFDVHPSGHASDSLSIALGLAKARELRGTHEKIVALIGDAALSGGMAFEALNTIGQLQLPMVIILNDNEMSISRNVGALFRHLGALRATAGYRSIRDYSQERLEEQGELGQMLVNFGRNMKDSIKHFLVPDLTIFEQLGIICTPPINGHNIPVLRETLKTALESSGPVMMHVVTKKGAGYRPAEEDPVRFHGVGAYDIVTGKSVTTQSSVSTYTEVFGEALVHEAREDSRIVALTAAMLSGTGLKKMSEEFPDRFVDVGIAEENAVGMAAGLAIGGFKPVVAIYSTFLQRAIDQMIVDTALAGCDVVFAIDRAGIVGEDGRTHQGIYDIAYCRMIPNLKILAPSNEAELVNALHTALQLKGPVALRYPRGKGIGVSLPDKPVVLELGKGQVAREGTDIAILAFGNCVAPACGAAEILAADNLSVRVIDMRWIKPLDEQAIVQAASTQLVVTVENGVLSGGAGEGVLEVLSAKGLEVPTLTLGINDQTVCHGKPDQLFADLGLDANGIAASIKAKLA